MDIYEWPRAEEALSALLQTNAAHAEGLLHRAYVRMRLQKWDLALSDIEQGITLRPENGVYWMIKGEILMAQKQWITAYEALRKAVFWEPDNARALYFLGRSLQQLGRRLDAAEYLERAMHFDRDFVQAQSLVLHDV